MTIDWSDTTLRTLDELAATAFPPDAGITRDTLKRRIRQGKLVAYRPGRAYLSTYAAVREMMERVQIKTVHHRTKPAYSTSRPIHSEMERVNNELDQWLAEKLKKKVQKAGERSKKQKRIR